jgi:glucose-1-phosphate adenylyltransferase
MILNRHIGTGKPWDMDRRDGGVTMLSPALGKHGGDWYSGTADSIYQNIHFIDQYEPEYVLVISGDHIYQMNYQSVLKQHKEREADATISVIEVPWKEASRFGILNTDENLKIDTFEEKPREPKSNLASMGIYIFTWSVLRKFLIEDAANPESSHDFGKDIIPAMLNEGRRLFAYRFDGYWKDVGTVQSYWEATMDLLDEETGSPLSVAREDMSRQIYTNEGNMPPQFIGCSGTVTNSLINSGCFIYGDISCSVIFQNVFVDKNTSVSESILHPGVRVGENVVLDRVIVMEDTVIPNGVRIVAEEGEEPPVINPGNLETYLSAKGELA